MMGPTVSEDESALSTVDKELKDDDGRKGTEKKEKKEEQNDGDHSITHSKTDDGGDNNAEVEEDAENVDGGGGKNISNLIYGSICLILYISGWESGAIISQKITGDYDKPYFLAWLRWTINVFYLICYLPYVQYKKKQNGEEPYKITKKDWIHAICLFAFDMTACSIYIISLKYTIVNISNTICMGDSILTYLFSICILHEDITKWKNLSVLFVLTGVIVILLFGRNAETTSGGQSSTTWGYVLLLLSEINFALFGVIYGKLRSDKRSTDDTLIFVGMMAFVCITIFWIPLVPMHFSGFEVFELPPAKTVMWIILYVLTKPFSASFLFLGYAYMGPLFMSIGSVLILPTGNVTEFLLYDTTYNLWYYVGMVTILIAFVFYTYGEYTSRKKKDQHEAATTTINYDDTLETKILYGDVGSKIDANFKEIEITTCKN